MIYPPPLLAAHLLVGACPICSQTDLHMHPVPAETLLSLLTAAEHNEPTPHVEPEERTISLRRGLIVLLAGIFFEQILAFISMYRGTRNIIRAIQRGRKSRA